MTSEIKKRGGFQSLEQEVFLNLQRTADALVREFDELLKPAGLSITQYNVLRILRGAGDDGLPCGEIGQRMITQDPDITRLLDRLEKRKLISRSRSTSDRRVVQGRITTAGLKLLAQLDEPVDLLHKKQFAHLPENNLKALLQLLEAARTKPE